MAAMIKATASRAMRTNLFAASQESDSMEVVRKDVSNGFGVTASGAAWSDFEREAFFEAGSTAWLSVAGRFSVGAALAFEPSDAGELELLWVFFAAAGFDKGWPRHCFSSHSTHRVRPGETGNPQDWHFCRSRRTGGTAMGAGESEGGLALPSVRAADQNSGSPAAG